MKIALLLSGGVDSSVALRLLKEQGHELKAFYLKVWLEEETFGIDASSESVAACPWKDDVAYCEKVCEQLGVPFEVMSVQRDYYDRIVSYVVSEIKAGRTPNPDVLCNNHIKFGVFLDRIGTKFDKVATGHYAQVEEKNSLFFLKKSPDPIKDQTYFLAHLGQAQLSRALFPIGHLTKQEVRELADRFELPTKDRKDSQGVCFLGKIKFSDFIKTHMGEDVGDLVESETGKKVGEHRGSWFYTIGQRQGLGLAGGPWYVVSKELATNTVFISRSYYASDKIRDTFCVNPIHWIAAKPDRQEVTAKLRHGPHTYAATIKMYDNTSAAVHLHDRDQGIAPGQFAVFYDDEYCLGSGVIE